jgi:predicted lipoprotein with Yx(FWY)xxD motif/plastocyanin
VFVVAEFSLLQPEVVPVQNVLTQTGWTIAAVHNHFVGENPRIIFLHAYVAGDFNSVVSSIKQALSKTSVPMNNTPYQAPTVNLASKAEIGNYLVNGSGFTLYRFLKDTPGNGTSVCNGTCAKFWPPFYTSNLVLPAGLDKSDFGVITRADGTKQVTYYGWPLYYYASDKKPGDTNGQGIGNVWFAYARSQSYGSCGWIGQFFSGHYSDANDVCSVFVFRQSPQIVLSLGGASTGSASSSSSTASAASSSSASTVSSTTNTQPASGSQIVLNQFETLTTHFVFINETKVDPSNTTVFGSADFAVTASEFPAVIQTLEEANFSISAVHNHIINESPELIFIHTSHTGNVFAILHVFRTVLAKTTIQGQVNYLPLTISTQDTSGKSITGYFQVEFQNSSVITDVGFSPVTFNLASGHSYQIRASDYGQYTFSHWADTGSTDRMRNVSITSPTQLVAVYAMSSSSTTSSASVSSTSGSTSASASSSVSSASTSSSSTTTSSSPPSSTTSSTTSASTSSTTAMTTTTSSASSSSAPSGGAQTIAMPQGVGSDTSLNFSPSTLTVASGTTVTFSDQDTSAPHNVVWTSQPSGASAPNSPIVMTNGNTFTVTLTVPGTYTYNCQYHSAWMKGTITVSG